MLSLSIIYISVYLSSIYLSSMIYLSSICLSIYLTSITYLYQHAYLSIIYDLSGFLSVYLSGEREWQVHLLTCAELPLCPVQHMLILLYINTAKTSEIFRKTTSYIWKLEYWHLEFWAGWSKEGLLGFGACSINICQMIKDYCQLVNLFSGRYFSSFNLLWHKIMFKS